MDLVAHPHATEPNPHTNVLLADPISGSLKNRIAIVTNTAQKISNAITKNLTTKDTRIMITNLNHAKKTTKKFENRIKLSIDITNKTQIKRMAQNIIKRYERIDILVNNTKLYASLQMHPFTKIPIKEWRQIMDVSVLSMFLATQTVVPHI